MSALALTDRDGLYGAVKHAVACADAGVAPTWGWTWRSRQTARAGAHNRDGAPGQTNRAGHTAGRGAGGRARQRGRLLNPQVPVRLRNEDAARIILLAVGARGWASLCRLVSAAHQAGERGAPVVTPDLVAAHAEGLVVLLGPASDAGRAIAARRPDLAAAMLARWRERADVVIEIVDHHGPGDTFRAARMLHLARDVGIPAVLTNAVRYLDPADGPVAQVLDAARRLTPLGRSRRDLRGARAYLASGAEMARIAARICGVPDVAAGSARTRRSQPGRDQAGSGQARPGQARRPGAGEAAWRTCSPPRPASPGAALLTPATTSASAAGSCRKPPAMRSPCCGPGARRGWTAAFPGPPAVQPPAVRPRAGQPRAGQPPAG